MTFNQEIKACSCN